MSDLFKDENKSTSNYMKFENVGDAVSGVYVNKRMKENTLAQPPKMQAVYTLINDEDGLPIDVYGKSGNPQVYPGLENAKFGQKVGLRFDEEIPSNKKGYNATKAINVYTKGDMDMKTLEAYQKQSGYGMDAPPKEDIPFD